MPFKIIDIWGNIGAGKSTCLAELRSRHFEARIVFIDEPVGEWLELKDSRTGLSLLESYYSDSARWAYSFQHCALLSRIEGLVHELAKYDPEENIVFVMERSPLADKIFADLLFEQGLLTDLEYKLYNRWFRFLTEFFKIKIDQIMYLDTTPEVCLARIAERHRKGEQAITIGYLSELHDRHERTVASIQDAVVVTRISTSRKEPKEIADELVRAIV
jgi:deoxyadenosine/deoxycytidine kinase